MTLDVFDHHFVRVVINILPQPIGQLAIPADTVTKGPARKAWSSVRPALMVNLSWNI